jgi:hypothetical protein
VWSITENLEPFPSTGCHWTHAAATSFLAQHWGVSTTQLVVAPTLTRPILSALVPTDGRTVVVAEPTCPELLAGILEAGGRYVDAGRTHRFAVHPEGFAFASRAPEAGLVVLSRPNEPTQTLPDGFATAIPDATNIQELSDERYRFDPLAPLPLETSRTLLVWRSLSLWSGDGIEIFIGPSDVASAIRALAESPSSLNDWRRGSRLFDERAERQAGEARRCAERVQAAGITVVSIGGGAVWARIPGVLSLDIADHVSSPTVVGSPHWTWRDAVRIRLDISSESLERVAECRR